MKRILTNNIVQNVRKQRFPKSSLDHLTASIEDASKAMLKALSVDPDKVTIISGVEVNQNGQAYNLTSGWAAYQDEIFEVDAAAFNAGGGEVAVWQIIETFLDKDPILFDDGQEFNVNQIRKLALVSGASGSGLADWDETVYYQNPTWHDVVLANGWDNNIADGQRAQYMLDHRGRVHLRGSIRSHNSTSPIFIDNGIPAPLRPPSNNNFDNILFACPAVGALNNAEVVRVVIRTYDTPKFDATVTTDVYAKPMFLHLNGIYWDTRPY